MKKYIIIPVFVLLSLMLGKNLSAQEHTIWELQWNISMPTGDFKNWIDETSIRGIEFGGNYHFETGFTAGGAVGYGAYFHKTPRITVESGNNTITAIQFRDLYSYYFLAEAGYAYESDFFMTPYARLGIGAYYSEQVLSVGLLYFREESWNFGLRPEIGLLMEVPNSGIGFIVNGKYNTAFNYGNDLENLNYFNFGLGVIFGF